jgi:Pregnancy-associated plasma protein-A
MDQGIVPVRRQCGAMSVHYRLLETDPNFRRRQTDLEHTTARRMMPGAAIRTGITTIPVIVHVVYRTPEENITRAQIRSQIAVLNRDFQAKNRDKSQIPEVWKGLAANARIQFALATTDPTGQPTTGVTRTKTTRPDFDTDDTVKSAATGGVDPWPSDRYLNIWVCTITRGILGYAQFPGGPPATDGVVILNTACGTRGTAAAPFHLGRTGTHEVGHWLNLRHIWGDTEDCSGSDLVADTPNAEGPNFGKPTFPRVSCNNGPSGDMFVNYMDYVDDDAMCMFTPQQVARMHATLDGPRETIGTSS